MSLTSLLKSPNNLTRLYLENNFPDKKNFNREWRKITKDLPLIFPQNPSSSYPWSLVGHAIDYRIRLFFEKYSINNTVAASGFSLVPESEAEKIEIDEEDLMRDQRKEHLWNDLEKEFEEVSIDIVGKMKSIDIESRIAKCCMTLSYSETQYRSGKPSEALLRANSLEDLFNDIPKSVIDDLVCLFQAFFESDKPPPLKAIVLNPTFIGSSDVGGADGDIIIDQILWDLKTTIKPLQFKNLFWPYQLIGYALLDYDDLYALKGCGIYLVRQAHWFSWNFDKLFDLLGCSPEIDISTHRERFRNSIKGSNFSESRSSLPGRPHLSSSSALVHREREVIEEKENLMQEIRQLRMAHGLTLRGMADRLNVPEKEWNRIFNGNLRSSSIKTLKEYIEKMKSWPLLQKP